MPSKQLIDTADKLRIEILKQYQIMDSPPEEEFDNLAKLASYICDTPISLISLLDENRQWFKAKVGLSASQTSREQAFCDHTIRQDDIMVVEDAQKDERFRENPFVLEDPNVRFYAGVPLINPQGYKLGSLCVIDKVPRQLDQNQIFALKTLAIQVMSQMELRKQNHELIRILDEMYEQNQVLEDLNDFNRKLQSIVSHDLKSPIGATRHFLNYISNGELTPEEILVWSESISKSLELSEKLVMSLADLGLNNFNHSEQEKQTIELNSFVQGIIEDVTSQTQLKKNKMVNKIGEMNLSINANLLEFIIRNLLQNANKFTKQGAICTKAIRKEKHILIIIQDNGQGIEAHKIKDIFAVNKFKSSVGTDGETGTGLGLAICQDFVTRMNGKIWVESEVNKGSTFYIKLPLFNA